MARMRLSHWGSIPCVRPFSYNPFRPLCPKFFIIGRVVTCYVTRINNTQDTGAEVWPALYLGAMTRPQIGRRAAGQELGLTVRDGDLLLLHHELAERAAIPEAVAAPIAAPKPFLKQYIGLFGRTVCRP